MSRGDLGGRSASACLCLECYTGAQQCRTLCTGEECRRSQQMEKESNRGLRLQVRPDLSCSVTHARLPHQRAPQRTRGSLFLVSAGRDPNHLFPSSPGGEAFFNACLLRRNPPGCQAMKSCPAGVATVSTHLDAESCPILPAVGTGCSSTQVLGAGVRLRLCPRPRPREPASRHLLPTFSHAAAATPPCPSPRFVQSCSSLSHSPSPPRGSGAPPFQSSGFPRGCPRLSELVTKSKPGSLPGDNKWGGIL